MAIEIWTAEDLRNIDNYVTYTSDYGTGYLGYINGDFIQMADIDLSIYPNWVPIGYINGDRRFPFIGNYDGNGFRIYNLRVRNDDTESGLFANVGIPDNAYVYYSSDTLNLEVGWPQHSTPYTHRTGTLKNINLIGVDVIGYSYVGALAGLICSNVINCYSTGVVKGTDYVGGLVGYVYDASGANIVLTEENESTTMVGCSSSCTIEGVGDGVLALGGLIGASGLHCLRDCWASGDVYSEVVSQGGSAYQFGGLVGEFWTKGATGNSGTWVLRNSVKRCYATGNVWGSYTAGGLIGATGFGVGNCTSVYDCFATGNVSITLSNGWGNGGGLIGLGNARWVTTNSAFHLREDIYVSNCYSTGNVTVIGVVEEDTHVGGMIGGYKTYINQYGVNMIGPIITNSFYDTQTSGMSNNDGGGIPLSTDSMLSIDSYTNWDFENVWSIDPYVNDGYPFFTTRLDSTKDFKRKRAVYFKTDTGFKRMRM